MDWYLVELSSEKTTQSIMRRVGKQIPMIFRHETIEIFIPVFKRGLDVFEMRTGNYIFVRSSSFAQLLRLKSVTGVVGLVTEGESNRPNKAIPVTDVYVQEIIKEAEDAFNARATGIEVGSFVRLLDGETRDYCGTVKHVQDGVATVAIDLKTKRLLVETPVRNLADLSSIPPDQRVFYYCPLVTDLLKGRDSSIVAEDLAFEEDSAEASEESTAPTPGGDVKHSRQKTVTALVKRLVVEGNITPDVISRRVVSAIKTRDVKAPKNLFIVYCIIKNSLMENHFRKSDPEVRNYREVIHKYGKKYKFSAQDIADVDPALGIPVSTVEVCKDGRSREARLQKKMQKVK